MKKIMDVNITAMMDKIIPTSPWVLLLFLLTNECPLKMMPKPAKQIITTKNDRPRVYGKNDNQKIHILTIPSVIAVAPNGYACGRMNCCG